MVRLLCEMQTFDQEPHLQLLKEMFTHAFATPKRHQRSKPFFDHVLSFTSVDKRVWLRNYQVNDLSCAWPSLLAMTTTAEFTSYDIHINAVLWAEQRSSKGPLNQTCLLLAQPTPLSDCCTYCTEACTQVHVLEGIDIARTVQTTSRSVRPNYYFIFKVSICCRWPCM